MEIIRVVDEARKRQQDDRYICPEQSLDQIMEADREQPRLVDRVERVDRPARCRAPIAPGLPQPGHPWRRLVHRPKLDDGAARRHVGQVAHRDDRRLQHDARVAEDLVDHLVRPRLLQHIGQIRTHRRERQVLQPGARRLVPTDLAGPRELGIETNLGKEAHEEARAGPSGPGNQQMRAPDDWRVTLYRDRRFDQHRWIGEPVHRSLRRARRLERHQNCDTSRCQHVAGSISGDPDHVGRTENVRREAGGASL